MCLNGTGEHRNLDLHVLDAKLRLWVSQQEKRTDARLDAIEHTITHKLDTVIEDVKLNMSRLEAQNMKLAKILADVTDRAASRDELQKSVKCITLMEAMQDSMRKEMTQGLKEAKDYAQAALATRGVDVGIAPESARGGGTHDDETRAAEVEFAPESSVYQALEKVEIRLVDFMQQQQQQEGAVQQDSANTLHTAMNPLPQAVHHQRQHEMQQRRQQQRQAAAVQLSEDIEKRVDERMHLFIAQKEEEQRQKDEMQRLKEEEARKKAEAEAEVEAKRLKAEERERIRVEEERLREEEARLKEEERLRREEERREEDREERRREDEHRREQQQQQLAEMREMLVGHFNSEFDHIKDSIVELKNSIPKEKGKGKDGASRSSPSAAGVHPPSVPPALAWQALGLGAEGAGSGRIDASMYNPDGSVSLPALAATQSQLQRERRLKEEEQRQRLKEEQKVQHEKLATDITSLKDSLKSVREEVGNSVKTAVRCAVKEISNKQESAIKSRLEDGLSRCTDLIQSNSLNGSLRDMRTALSSEVLSSVRTAVKQIDAGTQSKALKERVDRSLSAVASLTDSFEDIKGEMMAGRQQTEKLVKIVDDMASNGPLSTACNLSDERLGGNRVRAPTPMGTRLATKQRTPPVDAGAQPSVSFGPSSSGTRLPSKRTFVPSATRTSRGGGSSSGGTTRARPAAKSKSFFRSYASDTYAEDDDDDECDAYDEDEDVKMTTGIASRANVERKLQKLYDELDGFDAVTL